MKHLLLISYPFPPNASAGAVRSERFARYLSADGWLVNVVTIKPRSDNYTDDDRFDELKKRFAIHQTETLDPWVRVRGWNPDSFVLKKLRSLLMYMSSFPDHMFFWIPFVVREGMRINKKNNIDVIYTTSPPHSSHLAGLILSKILKKKWVIDFRDPWTLNADRKNITGLKLYLLKIESYLERKVLKNASLIISNTKSNMVNLQKAYPSITADKTVLLTNGWEKYPENEKSCEGGSAFRIVHAGTFYPRFQPYALLNAISEWLHLNKKDEPGNSENLKIILLGANDPDTLSKIGELGLREVVEILPWTSQDEARKVMQNADLLWATLGTGREASTFIPSKIFEYMAAEKPIIGFFPEGEACSLIRETGTGMVFTTDETRPVIEFISQMKLAKESGVKANLLPERNGGKIDDYQIKNIAGKFSDFLHELTKSTNY
ncbi:MAG: glycosyltransferase [Calditrichaceae bacterium]